jgi:hypothetical protein
MISVQLLEKYECQDNEHKAAGREEKGEDGKVYEEGKTAERRRPYMVVLWQ